MPGILPMKVIKVGNNSQSRIAQACDRCRSKKIRCDGIRPCCTQCANVGFECKTSDKLSRRAFPRGYTESLEDRVRSLEAEVRELKELLDEKDEKIDMLSRLHSFSSPSRKGSSSLSPTASAEVKADLNVTKEDYVHVEIPENQDAQAPANGPSTTNAFIDSFKSKMRVDGKPSEDIRPEFSSVRSRSSSSESLSPSSASKVPPRLLSDQFINIYFQEWAPLLPVLHRPTLLKSYEDFLADPESLRNNKPALAQLYLVFEIAALSSVSRIKHSTTSYEPQWRKALHSVSSVVSVSTLQGHVLAQIYYLLKADYQHLSRHRAIGVSLCHQLGLHQSQSSLSLGTLECETRKRAFWSQYVLDKFAAASMGIPVLLRELDVNTEYPADVDDENITEKGFVPTLPGELTKFSSSLAFFNASRILGKVMNELYPSSTTYKLPLSKIHSLSEELDNWKSSLPSHLRLEFSKDKPGLGVISSRSPLLSLTYFYIRTLTHRLVVCYGIGNNASASLLAVADSAKHIVQILDLLDERRMNYSFPLNKVELLLTAGFGLLWQCSGLPSDSKLFKDNQRSIASLLEHLERESVAKAEEFTRMATSLISIDKSPKTEPSPPQININTHNSRLLNPMPAPDPRQKSTRKQLQAIASRFSFGSMKLPKTDDVPRRSTVPKLSPSLGHPARNFSQLSISSARSEPVMPIYSPPSSCRTTMSPAQDMPNLDYLPLGSNTSAPPPAAKATGADADWERILATMDNGETNIYDGIYGGANADTLGQYPDLYPALSNEQTWVTDAWPPTDLDLETKAPVAQSVLSYSEESITSGEDLSNLSNSGHQDAVSDPFRGIAIPHVGDDYEYESFPV